MTHDVVLDIREPPLSKRQRWLAQNSPTLSWDTFCRNIASPLLTVATLEFARIILAEASLRLRAGHPTARLVLGLDDFGGAGIHHRAWWPIAIPGFTIAITVLAVNLVASWLRVSADPMQRDRKVLRLIGIGSPSPRTRTGTEAQASVKATVPMLEVNDSQGEFPRSTRDSLCGARRQFPGCQRRDCRNCGRIGLRKSITAMALIGLVPPPGRIEGGTLKWTGQDMTAPDKIATCAADASQWCFKTLWRV